MTPQRGPRAGFEENYLKNHKNDRVNSRGSDQWSLIYVYLLRYCSFIEHLWSNSLLHHSKIAFACFIHQTLGVFIPTDHFLPFLEGCELTLLQNVLIFLIAHRDDVAAEVRSTEINPNPSIFQHPVYEFDVSQDVRNMVVVKKSNNETPLSSMGLIQLEERAPSDRVEVRFLLNLQRDRDFPIGWGGFEEIGEIVNIWVDSWLCCASVQEVLSTEIVFGIAFVPLK